MKIRVLFLVCVVALFLAGCVTKEQQAFLEDSMTKKEAVRLVRESLKEQGIEKADISDELRYANTGKSKLTSIIEVDYTLSYSFEFKGRAEIDVKNNDEGENAKLGKVTRNGLDETNSDVGIQSELMFALQAMSFGDDLYQNLKSRSFLKEHSELELGWLISSREESNANLDRAIEYYIEGITDKAEAKEVINQIATPVFSTDETGYASAHIQKFNLTFRQTAPWTEDAKEQFLKELSAIPGLEPGHYEILLEAKDADTSEKTGFYIKPNGGVEPNYYDPSDEKELWINWYK
ncbi:hypothetical protein HB852_06475 [Listeria grandensis]|uniref:hypothetical protein n=1 Tax=Listeria grandensis TaxID=1494963 RepID=UPI00162A1F43|nr:hypothetical protein [Listeria grandensis]MBC1474256.1 hypothetical protein [Listeria grandensis]